MFGACKMLEKKRFCFEKKKEMNENMVAIFEKSCLVPVSLFQGNQSMQPRWVSFLSLFFFLFGCLACFSLSFEPDRVFRSPVLN